MNNNKKYLIILFVLILGLCVGFALLQVDITINGTSKVKANIWDIHFENLNVTEGSVELSDGDVAATIQSSTTDISYAITLNKPGDFYEFTVDAVNSGSIDGMVESVTSKLNDEPITTLPNYLNYSITYLTEDEIQVNHLLKANKSETYKVRIEFKKDITESDLPTTAQTLKLDFGIDYIQADGNGIEADHSLNGIVYTINTLSSGGVIFLNQKFPKTIPYFETPAEALNNISLVASKTIPFYLKHKVENGIVTESYVEFVITQAIAQENAGMIPGTYSIRNEKTINNDGYIVDENYISLYYESNKNTIKKAFGYELYPSRCVESGTKLSSSFTCSVPNLKIFTSADGRVYANTGGTTCYARYGGQAYCSIL